MVLLTDGTGIGPLPFEVFAYQAVKTHLASKGLCMCIMCVHVGPGPFPSLLNSNCARMDALMFSNANIWWLASQVRNAMYQRIHNCQCQCQ